MSATKCNKEGCWDGPAAGMVNLVQEPRTSLGKGGFGSVVHKTRTVLTRDSSYFYSIRCLCAGLRGGSKANRQTVLRDVEALRVKGVAN